MANEQETTLSSPSDLTWRLRLALRLMRRIDVGRLTAVLPEGSRYEFEGKNPGPSATIKFASDAVTSRVLRGGDVGFAESYMAGEWDTPDLCALLHVLQLNETAMTPQVTGVLALSRMWRAIQHRWLRRNTRRGSRRNIEAHYDLGNDFYELWLDEKTWAYSSAVFATPEQSLPDAQIHKFDLLIQRLDLSPEHHLLEIGCGWGGFACYAAEKTGCKVTGITLSSEQLAAAQARAKDAGVDERVSFRLQDYRDVKETYDRVVSIEMYEAVGESYWDGYFATIRNALVPGGLAVIQAITIKHELFDQYRNGVDFIQKYIFPGGMLASPEVFEQVAAKQGLSSVGAEFYGADYAQTLRLWFERVDKVRKEIRGLFDERFLRMWFYYLAYCEAGFTSGSINLMQITLKKD